MPSASSARTTSASALGAAGQPHRRALGRGGRGLAEAREHRGQALLVVRVGGHRLERDAADLGLQRRRRALGDDPPVVDDPDAVGEHVGLLEVLRREEDGDALLAREPLDLGPERAAALRVEARRRLVEEQHARLVHEREREVEAALHAARVAADLAVRGVGEADAREQLVAAAAALGSLVRPCSPPWRSMCSRPVRKSSSAASWSAAPIARRTSGPCVDDVEPGDGRAARRSAAAAS